jgi:hypothetical protein
MMKEIKQGEDIQVRIFYLMLDPHNGTQPKKKNVWGGEQSKFLTMKFFSIFCHFICLKTTYSPQNFVSKHHQCASFPQKKRTSLITMTFKSGSSGL